MANTYQYKYSFLNVDLIFYVSTVGAFDKKIILVVFESYPNQIAIE